MVNLLKTLKNKAADKLNELYLRWWMGNESYERLQAWNVEYVRRNSLSKKD